MNTLTTLVNLGVTDQQPEYIQNKIVISNKIAWLLLAMVIPYGIIIYLNIPQIAWLVLLSGAIYLMTIALNYFGYHLGARLTLSVFPQLLLGVLHGVLIQRGEPLLVPMVIFNVALFILPWMLFDLREYPFIMAATLLGVVPIIGLNALNDWFEFPVDASLFHHEYFEKASIFIGISIVSIGLYFFQDQGLKTEKKSQRLVDELNTKNSKFEEAEAETQKYLRQIEENQQEEKKRNWASEGLAKFAAILRSINDAQQMYDQLIAEVVKYMGASQGGLYIVENTDQIENMHIRLASCYAYERKKFVEQQIQVGQGLLGQAYLEKAPIFMTDVPEGYVRITSGLGEATPQSIVIMPLMINDQVEGFFELASFEVFSAYQLDFLQALGESVASAVANNRVNQKTRHLLEQTQQQAEELQAQEEEVRQNMEEMQATQESVQRNLKELQAKEAYLQNLINATSDPILTVDQNYCVAHCNTALQTMYSGSGVTIKPGMSVLDLSAAQEKEASKADYDRALSGKNFSQEVDIDLGQGKKHFIVSYHPIYQEDGTVEGVAVFTKDTTNAHLAALQVQEKEAYLMSLINATHDPILTIDAAYRIVYCNDAVRQMYEGTDIIVDVDTCLLDVSPSENRKHFQQYYDRALSGEAFDITEHIEQGGIDVHFAISYHPLKNPEGKIVGASVFTKNITELVAAQQATEQLLKDSQQSMEEIQAQEEELRQNMEEMQAIQESVAENEAKTRVIFENAMDAILMLDMNRTIEMFNPAAEKLFGYQAQEVVGKRIQDLVEASHLKRDKAGQVEMQQVLGKAVEAKGKHKDGSTFKAELLFQMAAVGDKKILVGVIREIGR